ncbi:MAG: exodeoxyribonuclease VII large subunit [Acidobacteriota bacterium]
MLGHEATYSISELTEEIREVLGDAFGGVWVVGEVQRVRSSQRGHLYFELVEKGRGDRIVGKIDAVIWRTDYVRVRRELAANDQEVVEGQQIRCWGHVDFYGPAGRLQLIVRNVDPLFSLGLLEQRRRATLAGLAKAGLLERNRQLELSEVPLELGLITSAGSAAYHDFLTGLTDSGFGFRVCLAHAAMQGAEAERQVVLALRDLVAYSRSPGCRLDAIVLIRGGGSRSDLAAFDSRRISEAIARCALPVLTGLGHEIDESIADRVSHTAFKTPTKVAEFLVEQVALAESSITACGEALRRLAHVRLQQAEMKLRRCERLAPVARLRLQTAALALNDRLQLTHRIGRQRLTESRRKILELSTRLQASGPRFIDRHRDRPGRLAERCVGVATGRLREATAVLDGISRLCAELAPEKVLERGFSMTRNGAGAIIREPSQVRSGESITTTLAGGSIESRVEKT